MAHIRLRPLRELPALEVDDGSVDVRGFELRARDGRAGSVDDLLADADALRAESLIVDLQGERVLVPVAAVEIDAGGRRVTAPYTVDEIRSMPRYRRDAWPRSS